MAAREPRRLASAWPTIGELWTFLAVALPALAALLVPMPAVDLAYHLRAGAGILAGEGIPAVDTWTFTAAGAPWLDQQWAAQALLTGAYQVAGWTGLALLRAALVAAAFGLVQATLRSMTCARRPAALLAIGAFIVAAPALALRPQLFAVVLFAASMLVIADRRAHPRRLWLLPVFAVLWANLHGSFPLILVLIGLGWLDELASVIRAVTAARAAPRGIQPPPDRNPVERLRGSTGLALLGAITAVATLANPFGIDAWRYVVDLASNPSVSAAVSEWRPPPPIDAAGLVFYASLAVALAVIALRVRADGGRAGVAILAPVATLAAFGTLGILTGRGLAWWALVMPISAAALAHGANLTRVLPRPLRPLAGIFTAGSIGANPAGPAAGPAAADAPPGSADRAARRSPLNAAFPLLLVVAGIALLPAWRPIGPAGVPLATLSYAPQGIAVHLDEAAARYAPGEARAWVPQIWASWFELVVPDALVAVDSRVELFPPEVWDDARTVAEGSPAAIDVLDRHGANVVVVAADQAGLDATLAASRQWHRAYQDADGSIWVRPSR